MQALILAGGKGSRLRPYTTVIPKPLMPIGDHPILEIILKQLKRSDFDRVILAVGHMSQLFQAFFQNGSHYGIEIEYLFEDKPLGTAGPILQALKILDDNFLVMNGDLLTTIDYLNLYQAHIKSGADATIALYEKNVKIDLGVIETDENGNLKKYIEKPTYDFNVSMGINILKKSAVKKYVEIKKYLDIPDLMMRMVNDGKHIQCQKQSCIWLDIGRVDDYQNAIEMFEQRHHEFLPE